MKQALHTELYKVSDDQNTAVLSWPADMLQD